MRRTRWLVGSLATATVLASAAVALGAGPWPGLARSVTQPDGSVRYAARTVGTSTKVTAKRVRDGRLLHTTRVEGAVGIPAVTINGAPGGLSPDGRTLVLAQPPSFEKPRRVSRFVVLSTVTLRQIRTISLRGDFGFDALSPHAETLYLIQHHLLGGASYAVRAYDVAAGRLLPQPIVDKSKADEAMRGFSIARATDADATWVYTLYRRDGAEPFIHALNTRQRYAVCIDLPWQASDEETWNASLGLSADGQQVLVTSRGAIVARIDTQTLRIVVT